MLTEERREMADLLGKGKHILIAPVPLVADTSRR
jgi:hypothetical protein